MERWYQFNQTERGNELMIYGDIRSWKWDDADVSAFDMSKELKELSGPLTVRINSYGGEVAEGLAIYNLLKSYDGEVTTIIDGFACSIASVIFLAGTKRKVSNASLMMIHNAWTGCYGNANDFRKTADDLEKIQEPSVQLYCQTSNLEEATIRQMMDDETWISANELIAYGFATHLIQDDSAKQSLEQNYLAKMIQKIKTLEDKNKQTKEPEVALNAWDAFFKKGN